MTFDECHYSGVELECMKKIMIIVLSLSIIVLGTLYYIANYQIEMFQPEYDERVLVNNRYGFTVTVPEGWHHWHDASSLLHSFASIGEKYYKDEKVAEMKVEEILEKYGKEMYAKTLVWTPDVAIFMSFSSTQKKKNDYEDMNDIWKILSEGVNETDGSVITVEVMPYLLPTKKINTKNTKERTYEILEINENEVVLVKNTNESGKSYTAMISLSKSEAMLGNEQQLSKSLWVTHRSESKDELIKFIKNIKIHKVEGIGQ